MDIVSIIEQQFGKQISLVETEQDIFQIYAPFFHEDGDMISMYLQIDKNTNKISIRDYGNTLMRLSYTFDIDTDNRTNIISNLVKSNNGVLDDGELIINENINNVSQAIFQYSQIVAKVSSMDILRKEVIKSLFYEYLNDFVFETFKNFKIIKDSTPTDDNDLIVDYEIENAKPIYIFGVNGNSKASKTVISCLTFQSMRKPFRSLIIPENIDNLTNFNRKQIINVGDKLYTSLDEFKTKAINYIERELVS